MRIVVDGLGAAPGSSAAVILEHFVNGWASLGDDEVFVSVSPEVARRYRAEGAEPVAIDSANVAKMKVRLLADNLLEEHGVIRHNSPRLAGLLVKEFLRS